MDKNTLVLVVTHKKFEQSIVPHDGYRVIKVGSKLSSEDARALGFLTDDSGDNIAEENPYYCELTAQYWAWKNIDKNIQNIGISHYRRYFFDYKRGSHGWKEDILTAERIEEILTDYKAIMPFPTVKVYGYSMFYKGKRDEEQSKRWVIIRDIIKKDYPHMYAAFEKFIYGRKTIYGNMIIAKRSVFDDYCKWLFDVLGKYDEALRSRGETRSARIDGYLAEPLLMMWSMYSLRENEIYRLEVRNTDADSFKDYKKNLMGRISGFMRHNRPCLLMMQKLKMLVLYLVFCLESCKKDKEPFTAYRKNLTGRIRGLVRRNRK